MLVDLTFWGILVPTSDNPIGAVNYVSVSMHFINIIFLMTELFLNELPFLFHYGVFVLMAGMTYLLWSWIYYDLEGEWDYFFMDTSKNVNALWQTLVFTMHILAWCVVFNLAKCRDRRRDTKRHAVKLLDMNINTTATNSPEDIKNVGSTFIAVGTEEM